MEGIKKASSLAQTSCLEGFHSVLNHFSPKMIAYCYVGQYCRLEMNFIIVSLLIGINFYVGFFYLRQIVIFLLFLLGIF